MTSLERYHARRAAGLCCICGEPSGDKCACDKCREYASKRNKMIYYDRVDKGLCTKCGKAPAAEGRKICNKCYEYNKQHPPKRPATKEERHEYYEKRRAKQRAEKLCYICGKNFADPGKASCAECREKRRLARYNGEAVPLRRAERVDEGLCWTCGRPAWNGYSLCEEHYKMLCNNLSKSSRWRGVKDGDISK